MTQSVGSVEAPRGGGLFNFGDFRLGLKDRWLLRKWGLFTNSNAKDIMIAFRSFTTCLTESTEMHITLTKGRTRSFITIEFLKIIHGSFLKTTKFLLKVC